MGETREIVIKAKGKSEPFYECRFTIDENKVFVDCTCMAGIFGQLCKHKVGLIQGNTRYLYDIKEINKLQKIHKLIRNTELIKHVIALKLTDSKLEKDKRQREYIKQTLEELFKVGVELHDDNKNISVKVLENLPDLSTISKKSQNIRLLFHLADFSDGFARNWYFCVPDFYKDALDIKLTEISIKKEKSQVWTQGNVFSFSVGDKFYNHPYAYCLEFDHELPCDHPDLCISIENIKKHVTGDIIEFSLLTPITKKGSEYCWKSISYHSLYEIEFIKFLISGPQGEWLEKIKEAASQ